MGAPTNPVVRCKRSPSAVKIGPLRTTAATLISLLTLCFSPKKKPKIPFALRGGLRETGAGALSQRDFCMSFFPLNELLGLRVLWLLVLFPLKGLENMDMVFVLFCQKKILLWRAVSRQGWLSLCSERIKRNSATSVADGPLPTQ
jgi:hypothetical protein